MMDMLLLEKLSYLTEGEVAVMMWLFAGVAVMLIWEGVNVIGRLTK